MDKGISFIFLCAGADVGERKIPKCLVNNNIIKSINAINYIYQNDNFYEIIVGVGYKNELIKKTLKDYKVKYYENKKYKKKGAAYTAKKCLELSTKKSAMIIHGDVVLDIFDLYATDLKSFITKTQQIDKIKIGLNILNNFVIGFNYTNHDKWAQLSFLTGKELALAKSVKIKDFWCSHELLKEVIDNGGKFIARDSNIKEVSYRS